MLGLSKSSLTSSSSTLLENAERAFSAQEGIDMEHFGANKYNDFGKALLDAFVYFFSGGCISLQKDFSYDQKELAILNETIYEALCNANNSATAIFRGIEKTVTVTVCDGGIRIEMDGNTGFIPEMTKEQMKHKLEYQTVSHGFSCGFLSANRLKENPHRFMDILAKSKTLAGVPVNELDNKIWSRPTITKQHSHIEGVSIHAGSSYIDKPLKPTIADATTLAYVNGSNLCKPMFVMGMVDGCGNAADAENSRIHSAIISTAAVQTAQDFQEEVINDEEDRLKEQFIQHMDRLYKTAIDNNPQFQVDTATFTVGVAFFNKQNELKLISFGLGDTVLAYKTKHSINTLHGTDSVSPFMRGPDRDNSDDQHLTVNISNVDETWQEFKLMTNGVGPLHFVPSDLKNDQKKALIQCHNNFAGHGDFNLSLIEQVVTPTSHENTARMQEEADEAFELKYQPECKFWEKIIFPDKWQLLATPKGQEKHQNKFALPESELVTSTMNKIDEIKRLSSLLREDSESIKELKKLTTLELRKVVNNTTPSAWMNDSKTKEIAHETLALCEQYVKGIFGRPGSTQKMLEERVITSLFDSSMQGEELRISHWNAIMQIGPKDDIEWRTLANNDGREKYAENFNAPPIEYVCQFAEAYDRPVNLAKALKELAGDGVMYVSVNRKDIENELQTRENR